VGIALFCELDILGGKKPLLVENTSNFAEASGVVVPIPVCALTDIVKQKIDSKILTGFIFVVDFFQIYKNNSKKVLNTDSINRALILFTDVFFILTIKRANTLKRNFKKHLQYY
jgi:hypothetical protein